MRTCQPSTLGLWRQSNSRAFFVLRVMSLGFRVPAFHVVLWGGTSELLSGVWVLFYDKRFRRLW